MIVNRELTEAKRAGFLAAYALAYGNKAASTIGARTAAEEAFPYLQERVVELTIQNKLWKFKVQAEDDTDPRGEYGYRAGTLLTCSTTNKRAEWVNGGHTFVTQLTPDGLRQLAFLLENPLENYVEPRLEAEKVVAQADGGDI